MNNDIVYRKHPTGALNSDFTHLHHSASYSLSTGKLDRRGRVVSICHQLHKFRLLNLIEWLVTCDDPFCQQAFEFFLVPWALYQTASGIQYQGKTGGEHTAA